MGDVCLLCRMWAIRSAYIPLVLDPPPICCSGTPLPIFHPEFGRFMLEATPGKPWGIGFKDLLDVEPNMRLRSGTSSSSNRHSNETQTEDCQGAYESRGMAHNFNHIPTIRMSWGIHHAVLSSIWRETAFTICPRRNCQPTHPLPHLSSQYPVSTRSKSTSQHSNI